MRTDGRFCAPQARAWSASRASFNRDLQEPGSKVRADKWQKLYYRALGADGRRADVPGHRTRLQLKPFKMSVDRVPEQ